jgi:2-methylcitrate dehydratase PrpD
MLVRRRDGEPIAMQLARFVKGLRYEDLPQAVTDGAKALVLDQWACELVGSTVPWVAPALKLVQSAKPAQPESTLVNHGTRLLATDVVFANATFGQACEMDDSATKSGGHIGTATVPVALAMAERQKIDGRLFLTSIVAGYEVMHRLVASLRPYHVERGWQSQGIAGTFAAAVVAGKILGLDEEKIAHAIAIAGSHSSGPLEYDQSGGEVKRIHAGIAARGGLNSALLAELGLTGPMTIIEGKRGFCKVFAEKADLKKITDDLGEDFHIQTASYKLYPTVGSLHTTIVCAQKLAKEYRLKAGDIASITVGVDEKTTLHGGSIRIPNDVIGAQFSMAFSVALAITKGRNELPDYMNPALWTDPQMVELMNRIDGYIHPEAKGESSYLSAMKIELKDGRIIEGREVIRKGQPRNPVTKEERYAKARSLCASVLTPERTEALIRAVEQIDQQRDVSTLVPMLLAQ